jgi:hypothetical protein
MSSAMDRITTIACRILPRLHDNSREAGLTLIDTVAAHRLPGLGHAES